MVNRRQSLRRLVIRPPVVASVGKSKSDLVFDLSEGGLSIYGRVPPSGKGGFQIEFHLPGDFDSIKTRGEIAWASKSGNLTGVRFIGLSDKCRLQLRNWMATRLPPAPPYGADYRINRPSLVSQFIYALRKGAERSNHPSKPALAIGVLVGVTFLCGLEARHYYYKSVENGNRANAVAAMPPTRLDVPDTSANASVETVSPPPISNSLDAPGFVLQVGAMKQERNADALSNSLKQMGFPVIVFRRTTDPFYRVAVGPYPDMSSAVRVKNELKAQNFEGIVRRWVPE
jgi:sporulation related protein/PilZ domain-containing protein